MLDALAAAFKESPEAEALDECATVRPINVSSGEATRILTAGGDWPDENTRRWPTMWSPASTVWTDRVAAAASASLVGEPESFTRTPVVFGVPETMARALGWPDADIGIADLERLCTDPDGWASVGKPIWGSFKISKTNPNTSTTGLSAILMQSYEAAGQVRRPHGRRCRGGRRLLACVRGVRHPLRRHDRESPDHACTTRPRTEPAARDTSRRSRSRRRRCSTTTRAIPTRTPCSPVRP